jgi:regulator of protease activity HflC (stomatin/prohibitin superfamily)
VSLKVQSLHCQAETKTKDNVFVTVNITVQYQAIKEKVYRAFYFLTNPEHQMRAYIFDVIRASLTQMKLDEAFESKDDISGNLKQHLQDIFNEYGFIILQGDYILPFSLIFTLSLPLLFADHFFFAHLPLIFALL